MFSRRPAIVGGRQFTRKTVALVCAAIKWRGAGPIESRYVLGRRPGFARRETDCRCRPGPEDRDLAGKWRRIAGAIHSVSVRSSTGERRWPSLVRSAIGFRTFYQNISL